MLWHGGECFLFPERRALFIMSFDLTSCRSGLPGKDYNTNLHMRMRQTQDIRQATT